MLRPNKGNSQSTWRPIDEYQALPLIRDAVNWIDNEGTFISYAIAKLYGVLRRTIGRTKWDTVDEVNRTYAILEQDHRMAHLRDALSDHAGPTHNVISNAISQTEGACLIALLFLVGFRCRELVALNADTVTLDKCADGCSIYRLKGIAAKKGGATRTWVASDSVIKVVEFIKGLYAPIRQSAQVNALFIGRSGWAAFVPTFKVKRLSIGSVAKRIKIFATAPHRSSSPIVQGLHPHAARKTFAHFVVLRDKRALESLSYHYGHTHRMITDGYYIGSDIQLAKLIDEEGRRDLANGLAGR
ncbi:hypothetical protein PQR75_01680 [Paraburkholderia fungorum]|uniref:hypothetical protein n=1 Tax=Paraburkholderia fungorum TaxID=134537 RepID=UPI0038B7252B